MPKIYRKVILGHETNMFTCEACLNENNMPQMGWVSRYVEDIVPGEGNPGIYKEAPLETCDRCFQKDEEAQEEMHQWCHDMDQQQWEEEPYNRNDDPWWSPDEPNPQEMK
jgi:hypothetical protein